MHDLKLGQIIEGDQQRDAIHVAVAPVVAAEPLSPGQHIGIYGMVREESRDFRGEYLVSAIVTETVGIVDPFLRNPVLPEQRFWMFLYPNTVTGMRHHWSHPAFDIPPPDKEESQRWMEDFADRHGEFERYNIHEQSGWHRFTVDEIIEHAKCFLLHGDRYVQQGSESLRDYEFPAEFWRHFEVLTGMEVPDYKKGDMPFCCTC